jgi:hypothetical protein
MIMSVKNLLTTSLVTTAIVSASAFAAPSAKFAANWADDNVTLAEIVPASTGSSDPESYAGELMATIKVPQKKELLIGVSGEARLITVTTAKSSGGVSSSSEADANLSLEVKYAPKGTANPCGTINGTVAAPGKIHFNSRYQKLSVSTSNFDDLDAAVEVGLTLDTVSAHHFNFVAPNLNIGEYDVWACFSGDALTAITGTGTAGAFVAIQKRMLTVQEVRAVNSDFTVE